MKLFVFVNILYGITKDVYAMSKDAARTLLEKFHKGPGWFLYYEDEEDDE